MAYEILKLSGKSEEEVLLEASKTLDCPADELNAVLVGEETTSKFLGLIKETVKTFSIRRKEENHIKDEKKESKPVKTDSKNEKSNKKEKNIKTIKEFIQRSEEVTRKICSLMNIEIEQKTHVKGRDIYININAGEEDGLIIGRNGLTLSSLQHIVNRIVNIRGDMPGQIVLDISGYRSKKDQYLQDKAKKIADSVKRKKREIVLDHLLPNDRRIVHLALKDDPKIKTYTVGSGHNKKIVIAPSDKGHYSRQRKNRQHADK